VCQLPTRSCGSRRHMVSTLCCRSSTRWPIRFDWTRSGNPISDCSVAVTRGWVLELPR
jgi:hypothetical protein